MQIAGDNFDVEERIGQESEPNEFDVDHRFSSEDNDWLQESDKEEIKEINPEAIPYFNRTQPTKLKKHHSKTQNFLEEKEESKSGSQAQKSEMDKIHDFMEEWDEELKSVDQTAKRNRMFEEPRNNQINQTMVNIIPKPSNPLFQTNVTNIELSSKLRNDNTNSQARRRTTVIQAEIIESDRKQQSAMGPRDSVSLV